MFHTKLHDCGEELRELDLRATPTRVAIMQLLEATKEPIAVDAIQTYLTKNKIEADPATVFRIMNSFTEKGITTPIQLQEGKTRYELTSKADHHHFICENCGSITDISDCNIDEIEENIEKKKGLLVKRHSLEFFGLCQDCQK